MSSCLRTHLRTTGASVTGKSMNKDLPQKKRNVKKYKPPFIIGWREIIGLPDFGVLGMPAKIDTSARTSALHAENQEVFERDGSMWVRFYFPIKSQPRSYRLEAPIIDERMIKNTSGVPELRIVIRTTLMMGSRHWCSACRYKPFSKVSDRSVPKYQGKHISSRIY